MAGIAVILFLAKRILRSLTGPHDATTNRAALRIAPVVITFVLAMQALAILIAFNTDSVTLRGASLLYLASILLILGYILYASKRS